MWTCLDLCEFTSRLRVRHVTGHSAPLYPSHTRHACPTVRGVPTGARHVLGQPSTRPCRHIPISETRCINERQRDRDGGAAPIAARAQTQAKPFQSGPSTHTTRFSSAVLIRICSWGDKRREEEAWRRLRLGRAELERRLRRRGRVGRRGRRRGGRRRVRVTSLAQLSSPCRRSAHRVTLHLANSRIMAWPRTRGCRQAAHWRYRPSRKPLTRERVLATVALLFHLGCVLFTVLAPEGWRTVVRAVRIHPYSRGRRGTLIERTDQVRVHVKHVHGARAPGSADARVAVRARTFFHPRRHGYCCVRSAGLGTSPFPAYLPSTGSRLSRRNLHPHLRAQALSRRPCLHLRRHVRPARRPHPPPIHHHAR
jgi:hypothetical protein